MSTALSALLIFIGIGIAVWLFSFVVEALRPVSQAPRKLRWAPDLPIEQRVATRSATSRPAEVQTSCFCWTCSRK
jgi:hypothetical protein